jgi:hypothetical protein
MMGIEATNDEDDNDDGTEPNYNEVSEGLPKDLAMTLYLQAIQKHLKEELSRKIDNIGVW